MGNFKTKSIIGGAVASLAVAISTGVVPVQTFAAQETANDFVFTQEGEITTKGGTATFTVALPAGTEFAGAALGINVEDAVTAGWTVTPTAASLNGWTVQEGTYQGNSNKASYIFTKTGDPSTFTEATTLVTYTVTAPENQTAGTKVDFIMNGNASTSSSTGDYFNRKTPSSYANNDQVVFSLTVVEAPEEEAPVTDPAQEEVPSTDAAEETPTTGADDATVADNSSTPSNNNTASNAAASTSTDSTAAKADAATSTEAAKTSTSTGSPSTGDASSVVVPLVSVAGAGAAAILVSSKLLRRKNK